MGGHRALEMWPVGTGTCYTVKSHTVSEDFVWK